MLLANTLHIDQWIVKNIRQASVIEQNINIVNPLPFKPTDLRGAYFFSFQWKIQIPARSIF